MTATLQLPQGQRKWVSSGEKKGGASEGDRGVGDGHHEDALGFGMFALEFPNISILGGSEDFFRVNLADKLQAKSTRFRSKINYFQ